MGKLSNEILAPFVGGDVEIQNQIEEYLYRGPTKNIKVVDDELFIEFAWFAKGEGYPPLPNKWVSTSNLNYTLGGLSMGGLSDAGEGRLQFTSLVSNETIVFFPPTGGRLDPAKVEGLKLS